MTTHCSRRGLIAPLILILVGGVFLLQNLGMLPQDVTRQWWPVLLVAVGAVVLARRLAFRRS